MSNKPNPVALLAAILMERDDHKRQQDRLPAYMVASLASDLCRLAPAIEHQGVAECNGEWGNGQRVHFMSMNQTAILDATITAKRAQLDRRITKLNERLAPFSLITSGYAGGGLCLGISSTDASRPLDMIVGA